MPELREAVKKAYLDCLNLNSDESVLVITDPSTLELGMAFFTVGQEYSKLTHLFLMPVAKVNGEEPPKTVADIMSHYDVIVCPTVKSLTHTDAKRNACKMGSRVATLPGITKDVFIRTMKADYLQIAKKTEFISKRLSQTQTVKNKTKLGTNLNLTINGMKPISSTGLIREKGKGGNIPSGESFLAPAEGKSNGTLVVDASIAGIGKIKNKPVEIEIKNGYAVEFSGGEEATILKNMLSDFGKEGLNVAELGIGTNDSAIITGQILEDEKVFGTIHIAFGNNISMGGTCNVGIHLDCVVTEANIWFDDQKIMENGKLLIKEKIE